MLTALIDSWAGSMAAINPLSCISWPSLSAESFGQVRSETRKLPWSLPLGFLAIKLQMDKLFKEL